MNTAFKSGTDGGSLASRVFRQIEQDILDGTFQPGQNLTEAKLCEQFGVSRTPVREALFQLEQEGLVQIKHNKGAVVVGISKQDIEDIYTIRMHVEGLASRWAAERITEEEKKQLLEILDLEMFYAAKENVEQCRKLDHSFHDGLYAASRSKPLHNTLRSFHNYIGRARAHSFKTGDRIKIAATEHKAILDAIIAGDGELAETLTKEHIVKAKANLLLYFREQHTESES